MKRLPNVNLAAFRDPAEYSEGEEVRDNPSVVSLSATEIAESLDLSFLERSSVTSLPAFDSSDYSLVMHKEGTERPPVDPVECVITCIPHPSFFPKHDSAYVSGRPLVFGWCDARNLPALDFQSQVNLCYKTGYQKLRAQIKFVQRVSPSTEKMDSIASVRKEIPIGRTLLHYIGATAKATTGKTLTVYEQKTGEMKQYPVKRLFENMGPPTAFVFDCDNAGAIVKELHACEQEMKEREHARANRSHGFYKKADVEDWIALGLCSEGEVLPGVSYLPRDLLTACLLSPLRVSVLCHILQYYRDAFPEQEYLKISEVEEKDQHIMSTVLDMIVEAVVCECMSTEDLERVFHRDEVTSALFRRFVLAQYLLKPYNLHPVSKPKLPDMSGHSMWCSWKAIIDQWLSAKKRGCGCFEAFIRSAIDSFKHRRHAQVKKSLLSLVTHIPYDEKQFYQFSDGLYELAMFISNSVDNRKRFIEVARPLKLCNRFVSKVEDNEEFQALCYLLMALIDHNPTFLYEATKEYDFTIVPELVFDERISVRTRIPIMCVISAVVPMSRSVKLSCTSPSYLKSLLNAITNEHSIFALWALIFLRRILQYSMYELPKLDIAAVAAKVSMCLHHKVREIRAAAVSVLSCFATCDDDHINMTLLFYVMPLLFDMSFVVRYLLLKFITKCISSSFLSFLSHLATAGESLTYTSFTQMLKECYGDGITVSLGMIDNYQKFIIEVDKRSRDSNRKNQMCCLWYFIVKYFQYDPHPKIAATAKSITAMIESRRNNDSNLELGNNLTASQDSWSMPEELEDSTKLGYDEDDLFAICIRQTLAKGLKKQEVVSAVSQGRSKSKASLTLRAQTSLDNHSITQVLFKAETMDIIAVTDAKRVYHFNADLTTKSFIELDASVTDMQMIGSHLVICDATGCAILWDTESSTPTTVWRADPYCSESSVLRCSGVASSTTKLITSRGNRATMLWDVTEQRIVREWDLRQDDNITQIVGDLVNPNIIITGYSSGKVAVFDVREETPIQVFETSTGEGIVGISFNGPIAFIANESGAVTVWDPKETQAKPWGIKRDKLQCFDVHRQLEMMVFAPEEGFPFITSIDNTTVVQTFNYVESCTATAMHSSDSMVAFGTNHGYMYCYQINN